jgi:hypothetical protein
MKSAHSEEDIGRNGSGAYPGGMAHNPLVFEKVRGKLTSPKGRPIL